MLVFECVYARPRFAGMMGCAQWYHEILKYPMHPGWGTHKFVLGALCTETTSVLQTVGCNSCYVVVIVLPCVSVATNGDEEFIK